jgi:hypothetical protein
MGDHDETEREGWQQVEGDRSPDGVGAEDQGSDAARPDDEASRAPVDTRRTGAE